MVVSGNWKSTKQNQRPQAAEAASADTVQAGEKAARSDPDAERLALTLEQLSDAANRQQSMIEYASRRNAYSFVKDIPRRPLREGEPGFSGDYEQLAADPLSTAVTAQRQADGTISLLGPNVLQRHARTALGTHTVSQIAEKEDAYNGGVATALWQLGFIDAMEEDIPHSRASFNPALRWSQTPGTLATEHGPGRPTMRHAQLAFDPSNELHAMLVPDNLRGNPALAVELELSAGDEARYGDPMGGEFMNLRVVPVEAV